MKKRQVNKNLKKRIILKRYFHIINLKGSNNLWDSSTSYYGDLYKKNKHIVSFYEHPLEGGYYPNGAIINKPAYQEFLMIIKKHYTKHILDNISLFNIGIINLLT